MLRQLTFDRPGEIDRRRARVGLATSWPPPRSSIFRGERRQIHPVTGGRADQSRAAHMHLANRRRHLLDLVTSSTTNRCGSAR